MARQVYSFAVTTPAGTAVTVPLTTEIAIPVRIVKRIVIKVPPGPAGHLGFQLAANGVSVIPINGLNYIVTDNEVIDLDVSDLIESGAWQVRSYNDGIYAHTIQVRLEVDLPPDRAGPPRRAIIPIEGTI